MNGNLIARSPHGLRLTCSLAGSENRLGILILFGPDDRLEGHGLAGLRLLKIKLRLRT